MTRYLYVIEPTSTGFSAFSPDLPGCVAAGQTREQTETLIKEAIEFHVDGLRLEGFDVPEPSTFMGYAEIAE